MGRNTITPKQYGTYGTGHSTPIFDELKRSDAYRLLTPVERLVLLDFIRAYMRASRWDKELPKEGFPYTWEMCLEPISDRAFYNALDRLRRLGFVAVDLENNQATRIGRPILYSASSRWRDYTPTSEERAELLRLETVKRTRIEQANQRRRRLRRELTEKCNRTEFAVGTRTEFAVAGAENGTGAPNGLRCKVPTSDTNGVRCDDSMP